MFTEEEKNQQRIWIRFQIVEGISILARAAKKMGIELENPENEVGNL